MTAEINSAAATTLRTRLSPDRPRGGVGYTGTITPVAWAVLARLWDEPFTVSSNFAREFAQEIALLSSIGWISTVTWDGQDFTRLWRLTGRGLTALNTRGA